MVASHSKVVTIFGSSRPRAGEADYEEARALGTALARQGLTVCTGGYGGVMEAASRGAKEAGGRTLGVTAEFFRSRTNAWVDEEVRVATWQERLFELIRHGDAYVACKGGTGTLVELAVVLEMVNKGIMPSKPLVALSDFWKSIIERTILAEGLRDLPNRMESGELVTFAETAEIAVGHLLAKFHSQQERS